MFNDNPFSFVWDEVRAYSNHKKQLLVVYLILTKVSSKLPHACYALAGNLQTVAGFSEDYSFKSNPHLPTRERHDLP